MKTNYYLFFITSIFPGEQMILSVINPNLLFIQILQEQWKPCDLKYNRDSVTELQPPGKYQEYSWGVGITWEMGWEGRRTWSSGLCWVTEQVSAFTERGKDTGMGRGRKGKVNPMRTAITLKESC